VAEEADERVPMLSLFLRVPAMQFEFATTRVQFATTHVVFIGIIIMFR